MDGIRQQILEYNAHRREPGEPLMTQRRLAELVGVNEVTVHRHATRQTTINLLRRWRSTDPECRVRTSPSGSLKS